ncbi:MAG TPA: hypothetical protein VF590_17675, partial [Isosphaeraceae bacterium]
GARSEPGTTFYRGFSGPRTLFDATVKDGVGMRDILDGTSFTLGIVEAREAVPWTKPDAEIPFDADARPKPGELDPLPSQLGGHFQGGFDALFLDGSVRFLSQSVNTTLLRALITRDAGEVVSSDQF